MEADDLDNLIADSIGGVTSALESERKAAPPKDTASDTTARSAGDALRDLKQVPIKGDEGTEGVPNEEFFCNLVKTLQDDNFQTAMADMLQTIDTDEAAVANQTDKALSSLTDAAGLENFTQTFLQSFENAVGNDGNFEKSIGSLMTSMLSKELICDPLQQIADNLEPWIQSQSSLSSADRTKYEGQLAQYRKILAVYNNSPDPLPEEAREEVQRLLAELHSLGQPPPEVMAKITPKDADGGDESFEDVMKSMGLDKGLGAAEQDLLKKLAEDPEELTKAMKEMAEGLPDQDCKQQ